MLSLILFVLLVNKNKKYDSEKHTLQDIFWKSYIRSSNKYVQSNIQFLSQASLPRLFMICLYK